MAHRLNGMLHRLNTPIVNNDNLESQHLGLHLNGRGVGKFALNLISDIRCL